MVVSDVPSWLVRSYVDGMKKILGFLWSATKGSFCRCYHVVIVFIAYCHDARMSEDGVGAEANI